jgi:hypothetical protein
LGEAELTGALALAALGRADALAEAAAKDVQGTDVVLMREGTAGKEVGEFTDLAGKAAVAFGQIASTLPVASDFGDAVESLAHDPLRKRWRKSRSTPHGVNSTKDI